MRTEPRARGAGKPDSYEQLHADLVGLAGQDVDPIIRQQLNAYGNGVAAAIRYEADEEKMGEFLKQLKSGELTPMMKRVLNDGYITLSTDRIIGRDLATTRAMKAAMDSVIPVDREGPGCVRQGARHVHQVLQDVGHGHTRASMSATRCRPRS